MAKISEMLLFVVAGIAIVGLFMFFPSLQTTGNVIADEEYNARVGDALSYNVNINVIAETDADTPIMVSLSKNGEIIDSKISTLGEFVKLSDNAKGVEGKLVKSGSYNMDVNKEIKYNFAEAGEYELYYSIFKLDIVRNIKITVK